jgi:uncharacterized membrane protein YqjE
MELIPPQAIQTPACSFLETIRDLVAFLVRYVELRLALFGLECRETGFHLLVLALLLVTILICFAGFFVLLVVFLLYLLMLILHWEWGWSALALAGLLLVISLGSAVFFRSRIAKPFFPTTMAEFKKDREWLKH